MTNPKAPHSETNVVETIQSLIVAFVLAMTFRGFVTEGFVIPTGSMAPTLLGQHALIHSEMTGVEFAIGLDQNDPRTTQPERIADPMLGERFPGSGVPAIRRGNGMGDRILVLKALYPFTEPKRFDVVVFKNPTDPVGDTSNYIKRLIGLPDEQVWLADGDVFAKKIGTDEFRIQRKPLYVQRAVWQPVHDSDFVPVRPDRLDQRYDGPPWVGDAAVWEMDHNGGREYRNTTAEPTMLAWDSDRRAINDWTPYNMLDYMRSKPTLRPVSDVRVSAHIFMQQTGLKTTLELEARSHLFQYIIQEAGSNSTVTLRRRLISSNNESDWVTSTPQTVSLPMPMFTVEFWHADQAMRLFINGKEAATLEYDWSALERLQFAAGDLYNDDADMLLHQSTTSPQVRWKFEGSPVTLTRVRLDRDLFYRHDRLTATPQWQRNPPLLSGHGFGTHPTDNPGVLGPDQFMMCGDNSQRSLDSRLWGNPHPLVYEQIGDDSPFTVNRKLLIGKAWVVYFPAPFPITREGYSIVPDFGRLRFIR